MGRLSKEMKEAKRCEEVIEMLRAEKVYMKNWTTAELSAILLKNYKELLLSLNDFKTRKG